MRYINLREELKDFIVFSINDIKKIDETFYRARLNEWQNKGYIKKVIKGFYIFSDLEISENILFLIANKIYFPSYISLESAFSYYNIIPEGVYSVTSITTRKTFKPAGSFTNFNYKKIKEEYFFGYKLIEFKNRYFKIASLEKSIIDYFYFNQKKDSSNDFYEMRLNTSSLSEQINLKIIKNYLEIFNKKSLTKCVNNLLEFVKNA
jgi:predicted transcriptional regulator of viral defense system